MIINKLYKIIDHYANNDLYDNNFSKTNMLIIKLGSESTKINNYVNSNLIISANNFDGNKMHHINIYNNDIDPNYDVSWNLLKKKLKKIKFLSFISIDPLNPTEFPLNIKDVNLFNFLNLLNVNKKDEYKKICVKENFPVISNSENDIQIINKLIDYSGYLIIISVTENICCDSIELIINSRLMQNKKIMHLIIMDDKIQSI